MSREFELMMFQAQAVLNPEVGYNGESNVRYFLDGLRMGRVRLSNTDEIVARLPFGDRVDPKTNATPSAREVFGSLSEPERAQVKEGIENLVASLKNKYPRFVAEFPEQFN